MMPQSFNLLVVEDDPADAKYLEVILSGIQAMSFNLTLADRLSAAASMLSIGTKFDAILLDLSLPDSQGLDTFESVHTSAPGIPIIVLTGNDNEDIAIQAVHAGAQDFLNKANLDGTHLSRTIQYSIERYGLLQEVEVLREKDMHRKNAFLSHVSHELRTPLAVIHQFVSILQDGIGGELNSDQQEYLEITMRNTKQLRTMIDDLLEVTRADTGKLSFVPKRVSLTDIATELIDAYHQNTIAKDLKMETHFPASLPKIYSDPVRVQQVLTNLIENAINHTPSPGTITVSAQLHEQDSDYLCIAVKDTGVGIEPEDKKQIFERLYQIDQTIDTGRKGLGLGLHICKELIEVQSGRIWVESDYGQGSTFYFTLPVFSIERLLTPMLSMKAFHNGIHLIAVDITPDNDDIPTRKFEHAITVAHQLLERCIYPDCDLLLPRLAHRPSGETFFIVAASDHKGATILSQRVRNQLVENSSLQRSELQINVSSTVVTDPLAAKNAVPSTLLDNTSRAIERIIDQNSVYLEKAV